MEQPMTPPPHITTLAYPGKPASREDSLVVIRVVAAGDKHPEVLKVQGVRLAD